VEAWGAEYPGIAVVQDESAAFREWAGEPGMGFGAPTFLWVTEDMRIRRIDRSSDPTVSYTIVRLAEHLADQEGEGL
jgi:hypothetical protein